MVASIGASAAGQLFNVNADTLAGYLAAGLRATRLVIAGATAGVLDADGRTIPAVDDGAIDDLIGGGQASAGMVAKLIACRNARRGGVREVAIVDGRRGAFDAGAGTTVGGPPQDRAGRKRGGRRGEEGRGRTKMSRLGDEIRAVEADHVLQVYRRIPVVLVRGRGCRVVDDDGREYLDLLSGIGVASLGHAHEGLARALADQAGELLHTSNLFFHPLQGELARRLARLSGLARTFFCNSGTEAVEACLKFARRYWHAAERPGPDCHRRLRRVVSRPDVRLALGDVGLRLSDALRAPRARRDVRLPSRSGRRGGGGHGADRGGHRRADTGEREASGPSRRQPPPRWPGAARQPETLLVADEVQCGLGRTGRPFYSAALGLAPDLMALGKALGGGVPVGAALVSERVAEAVAFGDHGSTYGGNLLACRAASVFLDALEGGLVDRVAAAGERMRRGLDAIGAASPAIGEVRGAGLMWGIEATPEVADRMVAAALGRGLLINRTAGTVVRLLPPLTIGNADIDEALERLRQAFADAGAA